MLRRCLQAAVDLFRALKEQDLFLSVVVLCSLDDLLHVLFCLADALSDILESSFDRLESISDLVLDRFCLLGRLTIQAFLNLHDQWLSRVDRRHYRLAEA